MRPLMARAAGARPIHCLFRLFSMTENRRCGDPPVGYDADPCQRGSVTDTRAYQRHPRQTTRDVPEPVRQPQGRTEGRSPEGCPRGCVSCARHPRSLDLATLAESTELRHPSPSYLTVPSHPSSPFVQVSARGRTAAAVRRASAATTASAAPSDADHAATRTRVVNPETTTTPLGRTN